MIAFDDYNTADTARQMITELAHRMRITPEFRFSNCRAQVRSEFLSEIKKCAFRVRSIVVRKHLVHSHHLRNHPAAFYNFTLRQLISQNELNQAKIRIDGNAKREFQRAAASYLRKESPSGAISNVKFLNSQSEPLIQLADMVTGAIARPYNRPHEATALTWRRIINERIENVWEFK